MCLPASSELLNAALLVEGLIVVRTNVQFRSGGITFTGWIDEKVVFITQGIKSKIKLNFFFFFVLVLKKKSKGGCFSPPGSRQSEKMTVFTQKACRGNLCLSYFLIAKHVITFLFGGAQEERKKINALQKKLIEAAPVGIKHLRTAGAGL